MSEMYPVDTARQSRSAVLQRAALIDAPAEEGFDRLTRVAKTALGACAAAVSVPVEDGMFLKSAVGFSEHLTTTRLVRIVGRSPCHEVTQTGQAVTVVDARLPPPDGAETLHGIGFVSYAGVPLIDSQGMVVGSFCVMGSEPRRWTEAELEVLRDLASAAATEIELRSLVVASDRTQALLTGQTRVLEMIARAAPLKEVLEAIAQLIESQAAGVHCSILLLEGDTLLRGVGPSLPESFNCQVDDLPIFPAIGPCGQAAQEGVPVVSRDLDQDDRWCPTFRALAREHGLRSCWSTPIPGNDGSVLGTFAMYYREQRAPGATEQELIDLATHLAGIAIEGARAEEALRQRAEALAEVDRHKDEFLAVLAHELRNPLASIRIALQLEQRQGSRDSSSRTSAIVQRQVEHLARLADDLLDVSRITRGRIELRPERLDVTRVVEEVAEDYRAEIEAHGLDFDLELLDEAAYVEGDRTRLAQVVGNILHNAVKFTERGGRVGMRMTRDNDGVHVVVEDTGIGMSPEVLRQVFNPFTQVEQTLARSHGGLGLGLALVANLVRMHDGEVTAESEGPGQGARFTVSLPLAAAPASADGAAEPETGAEGALRVLIIEDNQDAALMLQELLVLDGHQVRVAYTGPAGVREAHQFRPQAVICDLGLPGMDGYAVATALRGHPTTAGIRLIALSGYGQPEDQRRSLEHGFDLHLTKAADPTQLQQALTVVAAELSAA